MAGIIGHILPLALGVALSSVPIVVMVLILLSPRGRWSSLTYLIGAVIGLAGLTTLFTAVATLLPPAPSSSKSPLIATIEVALGAGLLFIAAVRWRRARRLHHEQTEGHAAAAAGAPGGGTGTAAKSQTGAAKWMAKVTTLGPIPSLGVGFVLMLRPKNLLLTIAAGVAIGAGGATFSEVVVGIALFVVLGISTLAAPIIFAVVDPSRMRRPLEETRIWIEGNSATVTTIVVLVLGTVIIGSGLAHY
ncbi:GAP family protein [Herbiconiux ginsengi]|uniref:Sap, sulfolipid-1-addressing protein n=1 Tax=Herbiconiux ginsengi TaxID=381665 RepID=A0A1H3TQ22_9MICO|nr:GAP family protein [Herbiconiux ginsengi]SDZ52210.1 Sap, sulfolipid-1-addressing protein [Herbiconiux ginsengi]